MAPAENLDSPNLVGKRIRLHRLSMADASAVYLSWLNDPLVQRFSRRRGMTLTEEDMHKFLTYAETCADYHFAIRLLEGDRHIGNIALDTLDPKNKSGEISIMIGDRSVWGKGFATEAISVVSEFAFQLLGLHRLWAQSPNPAFNRAMKKLGWIQEGIRREAFLVKEGYVDLVCWSILDAEYRSQ